MKTIKISLETAKTFATKIGTGHAAHLLASRKAVVILTVETALHLAALLGQTDDAGLYMANGLYAEVDAITG